MSFTRKRAALACTFCRSRKRRCDARKPACSNCVELEVQCHYDDTPSQRIDTSGGSREILSRLRDIETLLQKQSERITALSAESRSPQFGVPDTTSPQSHYSLPMSDAHAKSWSDARPEGSTDFSNLPPLMIPVQHKTSSSYLLSLPPVKTLIGEYPIDLIFRLESRNELPLELSLSSWASPSPVDLQRETTDKLVSIFITTVHPNHPILDHLEFHSIYGRFLEAGPDNGVESALCMVVLALGAAASASANTEALNSAPPGMRYMQRALPTLISLSAWSFPPTILLPQALVLASVYFAYIVRPLQSWRLVHSAATILQINRFGIDPPEKVFDDLGDNERLIRLYWSCFLIECDRLAELELPRSGLQELTDKVALPSCANLGLTESTCYLAEISVRRLLNRIHNSLYPRKNILPPYNSASPDDFSMREVSSIDAVCNELRSQLELWYSSIPQDFRPRLDVGSSPADLTDRQLILRIRYFASRHIIYRPFLLYIVTHAEDSAPQFMIEKAGICIESCRWYIHHTTRVMARPSQYTWTFALSSLGVVIVLTLASLNRDLQDFVPDIDELQSMVINNIRPWAISSLEVVVSILEDLQKKRRLLARV